MTYTLPVTSKGELDAYAWPGGYPLVYFAVSTNPYHRDEAELCATCATEQKGKWDKPVCSECQSPLKHIAHLTGDTVSSLDMVKHVAGKRATMVCTNPECYHADGLGIDDIVAYRVTGCDIHYEGQPIECDACNASIESAYGDPEEEKLYDRVRDVLELTGVASRDETDVKRAQDLLAELTGLHKANADIDNHDTVLAIYRGYYGAWTPTDALIKRIVGEIAREVSTFWDDTQSSDDSDWEEHITFASVAMVLRRIASEVKV